MRFIAALFSVTSLLGTPALAQQPATAPLPRYCLTLSCNGPGSSPLA